MRTPNHYFPILKTKMGDLWSLMNLEAKHHPWITPVMEAVPSRDIAKKSNGAQLNTAATKCHKALGDKPYFADLLWLDGVPIPPGESHWVKQYLDRSRELGAVVTPVTSPVRTPEFQRAVKTVISKDKRGVMFRVSLDEYQDDAALAAALNGLLAYHGVKKREVDLLIDLGSVHSIQAGTLRKVYRSSLDGLPSINAWRSLILAGSAFPDAAYMSKNLTKDAWNAIDRKEWEAWSSLYRNRSKLTRCPAYSDYTIGDPGLPFTDAPGYTVSLRYSSDTDYQVWRGRLAKMYTDGNSQMKKVCKNLIGQPWFSGAAFSPGDHEIHARATMPSSHGPGNATSWRQWAGSHYLALVADAVSNLLAP